MTDLQKQNHSDRPNATELKEKEKDTDMQHGAIQEDIDVTMDILDGVRVLCDCLVMLYYIVYLLLVLSFPFIRKGNGRS